MNGSAPPPPSGPVTFTTGTFADWSLFWEGHPVMPARSERIGEQPFNAAISLMSMSENLLVSQLRCTPQKIISPGVPTDDYYLLCQINAGRLITRFKGCREPQVWDRTLLSFGSPTTAFEQCSEAGAQGIAETNLWQVSRKLLEPLTRRVPEPNLLIPSSAHGALIATYMRQLTPQMHTLDATARALFEQQFAALIALAVGIHPDAVDLGRAAVQKAQVDRVLAYLDRHHTEPSLDAEAVARGLGTSARHLHRLLEAHGLLFSEALTQRRLATACRLLAASPVAQNQFLSEVAVASGFGDVNSLSRSSGAAYGAAPGELDATHETVTSAAISASTTATGRDHRTPTLLSAREQQVLVLVGKGFTSDEIAALMSVSRHTVLTYVRRVYAKLEVNSRIEAINVARHHGLLDG